MNQPLDPRRIEVLDDKSIEFLRAKSGIERLQLGISMGEDAARVLAAGVRDRSPRLTRQEVDREVARILSNADN